MKIKVLFYLGVISLLCSCAEKTDPTAMEMKEAGKAAVDESATLLRSFPIDPQPVDDSTLACITNRRQLSWYNIQTGKNIANFSLAGISLDSLIDATYNRKYAGKRSYSRSRESEGVNEQGYQLGGFYYDGSKYYLHISTEASVTYITDTAEYNRQLNDSKLSGIRKDLPNADFYINEHLQFLWVLNNDRSVDEVIPLYGRNILKSYFPSYQLGFAVHKGGLYVPLALNYTAELYKTPIGNSLQFYSFARLDLADTSKTSLLLNSKQFDHSQMTLNRLLDRRSFQQHPQGFYICNGKDIINIETSENIKSMKTLSPSEWITDFYVDGDLLYLRTNNLVPKLKPTELEKAYGVDSLASCNVSVYEKKTGKKKTFTLSDKECGDGCFLKNNFIFFTRDKEHYYIRRMHIE